MDAHQLDRLYFAHVTDLERRFARVLVEQRWDAVMIHSGVLVKRSQFDDQLWPLRPCPHFQHWLPLSEPDCLLVVQPANKAKLIRLPRESIWERPRPPESEAFYEALDVVRVHSPREAKSHLPNGRIAFIGEDPSRANEWGLGADSACPTELDLALDALVATDAALKETRLSSDEQLLTSLVLSLCSSGFSRRVA